MMTLIRGGRCLHPCPVCLVPLDELLDLSKRHSLHTTEEMKDIFQCAELLTLDKSQCFCTYENRENIQNFFTVSFLKKVLKIF